MVSRGLRQQGLWLCALAFGTAGAGAMAGSRLGSSRVLHAATRSALPSREDVADPRATRGSHASPPRIPPRVALRAAGGRRCRSPRHSTLPPANPGRRRYAPERTALSGRARRAAIKHASLTVIPAFAPARCTRAPQASKKLKGPLPLTILNVEAVRASAPRTPTAARCADLAFLGLPH
jgi:hypothetical protein